MKLLERGIIFIIVIVTVIIADFKFTRGYYTTELDYLINGNKSVEESKIKSLIYTIRKSQNNTYKFEFTNNSLIPRFFMNYRNDTIFQIMSSSFFFNHANRIKVNSPNYDFDYSFWGDCQTGIGFTSINSFEKFEKEISYDELLKELGQRSFVIEMITNDYKDVIYGEDIFSNIDNLILNKNLKVQETDSLNIQLYLPVISLENKLAYITSNNINVGYLDLIKQYVENEKNNRLKWQ
jgi:hypothetical protein